jgi:hypothetical protein
MPLILHSAPAKRAKIPAGGGGSITHGVAFAFSNPGAGTKSTPGPLVYDGFESGTSGNAISGNAPAIENLAGSWTWGEYTSGAYVPRYSNTVARARSLLSSLHQYGGASGYNTSLEIIHATPNSGDEVYLSFWRYHDQTSASWSRNVKPWIVYGTNGAGTPSAYDGWGSPDSDPDFRNAVQDSGLSSPTLWGGPSLDLVEGEWCRIEVLLKQSAAATDNGSFQVWVHRTDTPDISLVQSDTTYATRGTSDYWTQWFFGAYHATDTPSDATALVYIDDVYFDSTPMRVEIGNADTWAACTKREVQPATAWSADEITITPCLSAFSDSDTVYVYVVNSSNSATLAQSAVVA